MNHHIPVPLFAKKPPSNIRGNINRGTHKTAVSARLNIEEIKYPNPVATNCNVRITNTNFKKYQKFLIVPMPQYTMKENIKP